MNTLRKQHSFAPKNQHGVVLIASLVILLVLSFLAVQGTQTATLEEKMAGNFRSKKIAFESAEAALAEAEEFINTLPTIPTPNPTGAGGVYTLGSVAIRDDAFWENSEGVQPVDNSGSLALDTPPLFIIEQRQRQAGAGGSAETGALTKASQFGEIVSYRITARGATSAGTSVVLLQSHFERTF